MIPPQLPSARLGVAAAGRCRRRIHLDHDPSADRARRAAPDAGARLRGDQLAEHRRSVHDVLAEILHPVDDWDPTGPDRPDAIWTPRLCSESRIAVPDLLVRAPDGGYLPVLIRGHRTTDPGAGAVASPVAAAREVMIAAVELPERKLRAHHADALALAHVYRLLQELGLAAGSARGGVIGRGGPAMDPDWDDGALIVWHQLDAAPVELGGRSVLAEYDARFADRLAVARAAAAGEPALAQPSRIAECRRCPWWPVCGPELEAAHDVSLLVAGSDVDVLHDVGIVTFDDLAAMDPIRAAALPLTGIPPGDARARALALAAGVPLARRREVVDPRRADVELDVDMESYYDHGAYLWGTYLSGPGLARLPGTGYAPGYRPFVTWDPLDSPAAGENFAAFWQYLIALRRDCEGAGLTFAAYCYSHTAEERWLYATPRRFPDVPGMPDHAEVGRFCSSQQWVDLYTEVKRCFVVPGSLRLKRIAAVAGFAWRDPEPSGENSMAWYRIATGSDRAVGDGAIGDGGTGSAVTGCWAGRVDGSTGDGAGGIDPVPVPPGDPVPAHQERILRYNEDDVRATLALRRWMTDRSGEMPTVADLDAAYRGGMRSAPSNRMTSPLR
jgi:predicted RecB family nuclease